MGTCDGGVRSADRWLQRLAMATVVLGCVGAATPAAALTAYALRPDNTLLRFDTSNFSVGGPVSLTGLPAGEVIVAIDVRPATGQLYLLGSSSRLYVARLLYPNPVAAVTAVGPAFTPALSGTRFGFDFNPTVDRIRVVSDTGQNLRLDPDTGAVAAVDTPLNPGTPRVTGSAYVNNHAGATATTLYAIDSGTDQLLVQNPPNGGQLAVVGALGVDTTDDVGFDVTANDGVSYATLTVGATTGLYTLDLSTGAATLVGNLPGGPCLDLAVMSVGVPMVALRGGTELIRFHSATPGTLQGTVTVTGIQPGETLLGIDMRPTNGQLYGLGSTSRLYLLNPWTGAATPIGPAFDPLVGTRFAVDFGPGTLVVQSDAGQGLLIHADTASVITGPPIPPGSIVAGAFGGNTESAVLRPFYTIDSSTDVLQRDIMFEGVVGPLGVDTSGDVGFDISPLDDVGFAALSVGGVSSLYTIDLQTGAARLIGSIGTGAAVDGLTAMPLTYQFAEGSTGVFFDTDLLILNPTTSELPATVTYTTDTGRVITQGLTLPPQARVTVSADANTQLGGTAFSSSVNSPLGIPLAVERTMRWDASGYGMHTEKAVPPQATTWFFAEGSQGFFQTFFLLTNPQPKPSSVTLRFLLESGTQVTRTYPLLAESRLTIYAGDIPELVNQSFGTTVTFGLAGAAERAMYFGTPVFNSGHASAGATWTATDWFLAEGASNGFFTTFVLLSNPNAEPANATMTYLREGGGTVTRVKSIPAGSRLTINVAEEDASLVATSVATRVTSDIGIVVERAMYWPFAATSWQEAHNTFGVTRTERRWALAEGRVGGPFSFRTFVLVANPDVDVANVTASFMRTNGDVILKTFVVPAGARLTITTGPGSMVPELVDESFGAVVASDRPIFVERALYSDADGVVFAAGSAATATVLPQ